jgi:transposase
MIERIVQTTLSPPPAGRIRWTTRLLANEFELSSPTISKILRDHRLRPHAVRTYKASRDPAFVEGVTDVVGLYVNPPESAIVVRVDDEAPIDARENEPTPLPLPHARSSPHTHHYARYGVLDLYTALDVATGEPVHACTQRYAANDFLGFMRLIVGQHRRRDLHVIVDNSSPRCTPANVRWLQRHPRVTVHYAPTTASWLNQVQGFLAIVARQSRRGKFLSNKQLRDHVAAYIAEWSNDPTPFVWTRPCHCNHSRAANG